MKEYQNNLINKDGEWYCSKKLYSKKYAIKLASQFIDHKHISKIFLLAVNKKMIILKDDKNLNHKVFNELKKGITQNEKEE